MEAVLPRPARQVCFSSLSRKLAGCGDAYLVTYLSTAVSCATQFRMRENYLWKFAVCMPENFDVSRSAMSCFKSVFSDSSPEPPKTLEERLNPKWET